MQEGEEAVARAGKGDSFSFPGSWEGKARGPWGGFYSFQHMVIRLGFREQRSSHSEMYSRKRQIPAFVLCL